MKRHDAALTAAVFLTGAAAAYAMTARATPPCNTVETLTLAVHSVEIEGVPADAASPGGLSLGFQDDDPEATTFVANVYDPETKRPRALVLERAK